MVDVFAVSPLGQFDAPEVSGETGVSLEIILDRGMAQIFAAKGKTGAVERALKIKETPGKATSLSEYTAIPLTKGQWLLISSAPASKGGFVPGLKAKLKKNGFASEQSDSRVIFRLSGNRVVELMQKGCRLDLDPSVTGKDWCGQTQMAQIGVILHQIDEGPVYDLYVYSGFARDFAEWLYHSGAQFGISFKK